MGSSGTMSKRVLVAAAVVMCMVVSAPEAEGAITCTMVMRSLTPCLQYLRNGPPAPGNCCYGVRYLFNSAVTTVDRQTACWCMKQAASTISGINLDNAAALPSQCGLTIPYKISPSTDCSRVQ